MKVESSAFKAGEKIPKKYTCEGENISPPLKILDIPKNAKSLVIIVEDPDAPVGTFDHWLAWNITPKELIPEKAKAPVEGRNHFGELRYRGPCPPRGPAHRYYFKVFALKDKLDLASGSPKSELEASIIGHVLATAQLIGLYQR